MKFQRGDEVVLTKGLFGMEKDLLKQGHVNFHVLRIDEPYEHVVCGDEHGAWHLHPEALEYRVSDAGYRYRIYRIGASSERFGECDVCGQHVPDVWKLTETQRCTTEDGEVFWTYHDCRSLFGHKDCLMRARR